VQGVLEGFATIGAIIGLGFLLAHVGVLDAASQVVLSRLAFFVASPALMVTVLSETELAQVFSRNLVASAVGIVVTGGLYVLVATLAWRKAIGDVVIGAMSSAYVNAANLGIPISAYVLGDASLIAPMLLMQLVVIQPAALAILDGTRRGARRSWTAALTRPVTNPLTVATLVGVVLTLTGVRLPSAAAAPLELVAGMAVPAVLIAYGVSLRLGPRPVAGGNRTEIAFITLLKLVVQPLVAYVGARIALGLEGTALLAVTVTAALPAAQNIFVHAVRYDRAVLVARDAIFVTTVLSVPTLFAVAALVA
jgi:predicted permease